MKNPFVERIEKLEEYWERFRNLHQARLCIWQADPDETRMIEVFFERAESQSYESPDIFIRFETPFDSLLTYSQKLTEELIRHIETSREVLALAGIQVVYHPDMLATSQNNALLFLQNLHKLSAGFRQETGEGIVAFLTPSSIKNEQEWQQFLSESCQIAFYPEVRLMISATEKKISVISTQYPAEAILIKPNLDMASAMQEAAVGGNPGDPGVQFRKAFVALSQAAGKGNMDAVNLLKAKPLAIASEQGWTQMAVAVYSLIANAWLNIKKYEEALQSYESGLSLALMMHQRKEPAGTQLAVQTFFGKAAVFLAMNNPKDAAGLYEKAETLAGDDFFSLMESQRMAGYCYQSLREAEKAWLFYNKAMETAALLDEPTRKSSTLSYTGQALIRLATQLGKAEEKMQIQTQLESWLGQGWEKT